MVFWRMMERGGKQRIRKVIYKDGVEEGRAKTDGSVM